MAESLKTTIELKSNHSQNNSHQLPILPPTSVPPLVDEEACEILFMMKASTGPSIQKIVQIEKPIENTTQKNSKKQTKQKPLKANDEEWVSNNNKKNLPIIPNQSQTTTTTNPIQNLPRITINNNSDEEVEFEDVFSEDDLSDSKISSSRKSSTSQSSKSASLAAKRKKAASGSACELHKKWKKRCPDDCPHKLIFETETAIAQLNLTIPYNVVTAEGQKQQDPENLLKMVIQHQIPALLSRQMIDEPDGGPVLLEMPTTPVGILPLTSFFIRSKMQQLTRNLILPKPKTIKEYHTLVQHVIAYACLREEIQPEVEQELVKFCAAAGIGAAVLADESSLSAANSVGKSSISPNNETQTTTSTTSLSAQFAQIASNTPQNDRRWSTSSDFSMPSESPALFATNSEPLNLGMTPLTLANYNPGFGNGSSASGSSHRSLRKRDRSALDSSPFTTYPEIAKPAQVSTPNILTKQQKTTSAESLSYLSSDTNASISLPPTKRIKTELLNE